MQTFLAEVLDRTSVNNINVSNFVKDNVFSYATMFTSDDLIKTTLINWVYNEIFHTFPSKITVEKVFPNVNTFNDMYVTFNHRVIELDKLTKAFDKYKLMIIDMPSFLKEQVWKKLHARKMTQSATYNPDITLFKQFNSQYDYASDRRVITTRGYHLRNPITQYNCSQYGGVLPECVTSRDVLLHTLFVDKTFMNMIGNIVIVVDRDGALGAIKALKKSHIIISAVELPEAHFVCENILEYIDMFASLIYTTNELMVTPLRCTVMTPPKELQQMMLHFPRDADALTEAYFSTGGIPPFVLNHIFQYFNKNQCHKRLINENNENNENTTENCIFIIDSRPNILSVISVMITHYNIPWNIVVCTSLGAQQYYTDRLDRLGSHVKFMTHPLLDLNRPFEIGDYNIIMKDYNIWKNVRNMGYHHSLIIQDDGMIFRGGIERYLQYEYVGAPWPDQSFMKDAGVVNPVGNGGLSLRNNDAMMKITQEKCDDKNALYFNNSMVIPEDVYFSKFSKTPSVAEAKQFAFEMLFDENALGFHKPWPYIKAELISIYFKKLESMG